MVDVGSISLNGSTIDQPNEQPGQVYPNKKKEEEHQTCFNKFLNCAVFYSRLMGVFWTHNLKLGRPFKMVGFAA